MRLSVRFLIILFPVLAGVAIAFNGLMDRLEGQWALKDQFNRAQLLYDSIQDPILESVQIGRLSKLHRIYERISDDPSLMGVMVCSRDGKIISKSPRVPKGMKCEWVPDGRLVETVAENESGLIEIDGRNVHRALFPLFDETKKTRAYVVIFHDPSYHNQRSELTRRYTIYAFLGLGFLISLITLLVYRWSVSRPVQQLSEVMKGVLTGDSHKIVKALENTDFAPLVKDLDQMIVDFRLQKQDGVAPEDPAASPFNNAAKLNTEMQSLFGESRLCVIANEEPYIHERHGGSVVACSPASGLVHVVEPIIRATSGVWIGHATGSADQETADKNGMLLVPPDKPEYALKRVWLSRDEEQGFHYGFSKEGLWPLCHIAHERPNFRQEDWQQYVAVNAKFASTFAEEMKASRPVALIQDYHFALLPEMIRKMRPDSLTGLFWHIPWPNPENIRICPWRNDILTGMLGADLIGFQLQDHVTNFFDTVDRFLEARVSRDRYCITYRGHTCFVKPFPVSVEFPPRVNVPPSEIPEIRKRILRSHSVHPDARIGLAVDRLDYTKGIIERFHAVERFLERHPDQVGKFVFIQVVAPTKMHIKRYQDLEAEIQKVVDRINWRYYSASYQPILLKSQSLEKTAITELYRTADLCFVNSLHDGMNLTGKEYVSARSDGDGVLILSSFTGAAREMKDAVIVNPYDSEECADAIWRALTMDIEDRRSRMGRLRSQLASHNVYDWGTHYLRELAKISDQQQNPSDTN